MNIITEHNTATCGFTHIPRRVSSFKSQAPQRFLILRPTVNSTPTPTLTLTPTPTPTPTASPTPHPHPHLLHPACSRLQHCSLLVQYPRSIR